jgi:hypothetical protein
MPLRLVTKSSLSTYRACPRLYQYLYVLCVRPAVEPEAAHTGTLAHRGLEAWWLAAKRGADPDGRLQAARAAIADEPNPYERARMEALLAGYTTRWADVPIAEVLGVEVEFRVPVYNPETGHPSRTWELGGKIDAVVSDAMRILIVEHKVTSEDTAAGSNYWRRLRIDQQVSAYYEGARALYGDVWGCIYDVISKPALRPLKATPPEARKYKQDGKLYANQRDTDETPEEYGARIAEAIAADPQRYYQRGDVVRLEEEMRDAQLDIWQTTRALRDSELLNSWPRNPDACVRYGRTCEFLPVCCGEASIDDPMLFRQGERVHEELEDKWQPYR